MNIKNSNQQQAGAIPQQLLTPVPDTIELQQQQQLETVFNLKSKQFKFDCGLTMGNLLAPITNLKFSLRYHDECTSNFEEFLASVKSFLAAAGTAISLTESDIARLKVHYDKHSINKR